MYIFHSDATGRAFSQLLSRRAREGLEVCVLYDSFGSAATDPDLFRRMRATGVHVREYHPWKPWTVTRGWHAFYRDHRKLLVVDGDVAGLGGLNVSDEYGGSWVSGEPYCDPWRDTAVGLYGPAVRLFAAAFDRSWHYAGHGGSIRETEFFQSSHQYRTGEPGGLLRAHAACHVARDYRDCSRRFNLEIADDCLAVLGSVPRSGGPLVPALLKLLRDARSSIEITMAYFAPPDAILKELAGAARRGVRVRLMLPGRSDVPLLQVAARGCYEALLRAGVEVFERQGAVLHSKTLCVDGRVSLVGSINLDYRSLRFNSELGAVVHSRPFGAEVHRLFEHDVRYSRRVDLKEWRQRPFRERLAQWAVLRARHLL